MIFVAFLSIGFFALAPFLLLYGTQGVHVLLYTALYTALPHQDSFVAPEFLHTSDEMRCFLALVSFAYGGGTWRLVLHFYPSWRPYLVRGLALALFAELVFTALVFKGPLL